MSNLPEELTEKKLSEQYEEDLNLLIKRIITFFKAFIHQSSDNSLIVMSFYIFKDLCKTPVQYGYLNFDIFYIACINIFNNFNINGSTINYIKN